MKTIKLLGVLFGAVLVLTAARDCPAQVIYWQSLPNEVEFGVTASIGGSLVQSPSAFEPGYDGAWLFGNSMFYGMGQTFIVSSTRTLQSIELRVGGMNAQPTYGQFEVAIYEFDPISASPTLKLGAVLANAQDYYNIDLVNAPVSSFDFSSFDISLQSGKTYALAVTPTDTFTGGLLSLQAALDIYPGGTAYSLVVVPEPNMIALCSLGTVLALCVTRARTNRERRLLRAVVSHVDDKHAI